MSLATISKPRYLSDYPEDTDLTAANLGADMQGLPMTPQGLLLAGVMEAKSDREVLDKKTGKPNGRYRPLYRTVVSEIPRRSTKTTSVQNVLLGRCSTIPGYRVVSTAQDGTRASEFFAEMISFMEAEEPDESLRDWKPYHSQGRERIDWANGSKWWVVKPDASALRGKAADVMWFDEAGELDPEKSADLLSGALPIMDTKPEGQVIITGTPGLVRAGLLWEFLERGRAQLGTENPKVGICDFTAEKDDGTYLDPESVDTWFETHPGLACGLTELDIIQERREALGLPKFMREYLCIWPPDSKITALDLKKWKITETEALTAPPEGVPWGIGWDVAIGGDAAAVAVAWVDEHDEPHVQIMDHRAGSQWVAAYVAKAIGKFPRVPVGYDSIGDNITVAQALGRMPRVKTTRVKALTLKEVAASTAVISQSVNLMSIHHPPHTGLDAAVKNTTWRDSNGSRLFMRAKGIEISCLLAATHALAVASTAKRTSTLQIPDAAVG